MRSILGISAVLAACLAAAPASAATLLYSFTTDEPFAGGTVAFTYRSEGPAPVNRFIPRAELASATAGLARIRFLDVCFTTAPGQSDVIACDLVEAFVDTDFGTAQVIRQFADGALRAPGTYRVFSGTPATLTVSFAGAVPEPATWAVLMLGIGATGGALRTRRKLAVA